MPHRKLKVESKPAGFKRMATSKSGSAMTVQEWRIPLIYLFHSSRLRRAVPVSVSCCRGKSPQLTAERLGSRFGFRALDTKAVFGCLADVIAQRILLGYS